LLLVNYRPEYRHEWTNKSYYAQLRLEPRGGADGTAMLAALLGERVELNPLKRLITDRTGGIHSSLKRSCGHRSTRAH
jgi:hypothetical protein